MLHCNNTILDNWSAKSVIKKMVIGEVESKGYSGAVPTAVSQKVFLSYPRMPKSLKLSEGLMILVTPSLRFLSFHSSLLVNA